MSTRSWGINAGALLTQSSTMPADTVALIIIDRDDQLSHGRLHQLVESSLPQLARCRSRLVGKPLGLGQPMWAEITNYELVRSRLVIVAIPIAAVHVSAATGSA